MEKQKLHTSQQMVVLVSLASCLKDFGHVFATPRTAIKESFDRDHYEVIRTSSTKVYGLHHLEIRI